MLLLEIRRASVAGAASLKHLRARRYRGEPWAPAAALPLGPSQQLWRELY